MPHKVTVLAHEGHIILIPHAPLLNVDRNWSPVNNAGRLGSVLGDSRRQLACSKEALDLMRSIRRNADAIGDLGWWLCADGTYAFSWFGALYRVIDPKNAEGDRDFHVHEQECTVVPNEIPEDILEQVRVAVAEKRALWREPFRLGDARGPDTDRHLELLHRAEAKNRNPSHRRSFYHG
jgi:hypothetical protein